MSPEPIEERPMAFANVRVFDGHQVLEDQTVVIKGKGISTASNNPAPIEASVIDGRGKTLLPGLIDSHVHTDMEGLGDALKFGVTTELEMSRKIRCQASGTGGRLHQDFP